MLNKQKNSKIIMKLEKVKIRKKQVNNIVIAYLSGGVKLLIPFRKGPTLN